ncbi:MAG: SPOR domain-containing protein [Bacteroidales bacterium]|nr:SPOR domain-containing protein [Bacteroidales bacterium]
MIVKQPKTFEAGTSGIVELHIQKSSIDGVSKLEVTIPTGFAIRAIETSGAQFIKQNNVGKFVWVDLPKTEDVVVKYQIYIPKNIEGNHLLNNTFYYIDQNEKRHISFASCIKISEKGDAINLIEISELLKDLENAPIVFRLQVGAYKKAKVFNNKLSNDSLVCIEQDGFYKYSIGPFISLEDAFEAQKKSPYKGAFIVLFFVDKPISKQQAYSILKH